jgi:hypothetical protein
LVDHREAIIVDNTIIFDTRNNPRTRSMFAAAGQWSTDSWRKIAIALIDALRRDFDCNCRVFSGDGKWARFASALAMWMLAIDARSH